jgi:hypothetical protein
MGGLSDFCLNFSPTVERLNLALHSALESLLLADAVDAIVGFDGKEHKKKSFNEKIEYHRWHQHAEKLQVVHGKVKVK